MERGFSRHPIDEAGDKGRQAGSQACRNLSRNQG